MRKSACHLKFPTTLLYVAAVLLLVTPAAAQRLDTLVHFQCSTLGCAPNDTLIQARDGFFYGTTSEADILGRSDGTTFRMDRTGGIVVLTSARSFFEGADGFFYGTDPEGGAFGAGSVFRMDTSGTVVDLHSFDGTAAARPGSLVQAPDGAFFGVVSVPGADRFRLFHMDATLTVRLLRGPRQPIGVVRTLLFSRPNFLYGTTYDGVVFRMNRNGQTRVLHSFPSVYVDLMQASDGWFYGVTIDGGAYGAGLIFRLSRSGRVQVLHSFDGGAGGAFPYEAPIEGHDGYFYGTTGQGGAFGEGTVYRMDRSGAVTILHSFGESADAGALPVGEIVQGDDGALYGTTVRGGLFGHGTAWRLELAPANWSLSRERHRDRNQSDGAGSARRAGVSRARPGA